MNYLLGLTLTGILSGLAAGVVGGGAEILIVPLLTMFGLLKSLKVSKKIKVNQLDNPAKA